MNIIEKYFRSKTDKISFIELMDNVDTYKKYGIKDDVPLPIILDEMVGAISENEFTNEISMEYIIDGMLFMIAIDPEFTYTHDYKEILNRLIDNPSNYALSKGVRYIDVDLEASTLYTRAAFILNEKNELAAYNYAKILWNLEVPKDEQHVYTEEAVRILERILNFNDKNPLANYELGNISAATGNYIKANSYYNRALTNSELEELKETVRNAIIKISPDVAVENAIYSINKMDYNSAITNLMEARKNSSRFDIPYYIAIAYMNSENPVLAEQFFEESLEKGADFSTLYTDLVYVKYLLNKEYEAIQIANEAVEKYPSDIKLRYNRAVILISLNQNKKAIEDLDFILEYQDLSDEMFNQIMKIKESIYNK